MRQLGGARGGQSRLVESILAAVVIFIVFSVAVYLVTSTKIGAVYERGDLDRAGYNLLHTLAESRAVEETVEAGQPALLKMMIQRLIPPMTYFNMSVYNITTTSDNVTMTMIPIPFTTNPVTYFISNAESETSFTRSVEVSSTSFIYTSKSGNIYLIVLRLARSGQGT